MILALDPRGREDSPQLHVIVAGTAMCGRRVVPGSGVDRELDADTARHMCLTCAGLAKIDLCAILGQRGAGV